MKLSTQNIIKIAPVLGVLAIIGSCSKDLPEYVGFEPYLYASASEDGGSWQPILLTSGADTVLTAPLATTDPAYIAELDEVKSYNGSLSADEQEAVDYWGNNTVIRWQEIAQELVAKYNLAPSPDAEGNYPSPSSAAPDVYPYFPFAHPTYAARVYAYLGAAQYDALIVTWNHKYSHNRPAPYTVDGSIEPAYPDNALPSWPSEDATIAEVSSEILKFMFPLEVDYLNDLATDCRNSRKYAGMNVESDLLAGEEIGAYVFRKYKARAANDSMKFAQVDKPTYQAMEATADAMWGNQWPHWENLEIPQRPVGITPKYGSVNTWWVDDLTAVRPGPPPAIGSAEYLEAEAELLDYTKNATKEEEAIAYFWGDGFGTYAPPGHWGRIAAEYMISYQLNPLQSARVFAYLNTAMMDAGISCWDTKYYYFYPRPPQANSEIKTLLGLPNFPSYTSGHSTFSAAAATVLSAFFPAEGSYFMEQAQEAADSRVYSRIHFRFDSEAGLTAGNAVGAYAVTAMQADGGH